MGKGKPWSWAIDASSLIAPIQYLLRFDEKGVVRALVLSCFKDGRLVLLEKIRWEVRRSDALRGRGGLLWEVPFVKDKEIDKAHIKVKRKWANPDRLSTLSSGDFARECQIFHKLGDYYLLAYCLMKREKDPSREYGIVTEESRHLKDGKVFKKIPVIGDDEGIETLDLVQFLQNQGLKVDFRVDKERGAGNGGIA